MKILLLQGASPTIVARVLEKSTDYAALGLVGLVFGFVLIGGVNKGRRKIGLLMIGFIMTASLVVSCSDGGGGGGTPPQGDPPVSDPPTADMALPTSNLKRGTSYFWKVRADDGKGGISESETRFYHSFLIGRTSPLPLLCMAEGVCLLEPESLSLPPLDSRWNRTGMTLKVLSVSACLT